MPEQERSTTNEETPTMDRLVQLVRERFATFGGGRDSEWNQIAHALKDKPLTFAAGVDVRDVVEFVIQFSGQSYLLSTMKTLRPLLVRISDMPPANAEFLQLVDDAIAAAEGRS